MGKEKKKGFFAQFRDFIAKGNVLDMAIGVVIGAFGSVISLNKYLKEHNKVVESD